MTSTLNKFKIPKKLIPILHKKLHLHNDVDISYFGNRIKDLKHGEINGYQAFLVNSGNGWFLLRPENTYGYRSRSCFLSKFNETKGLVKVGKIEKKSIGSHILPINAIYKIIYGSPHGNQTEDWRRSIERQVKKEMSRICPMIFKNRLDFLQTAIAEYSQSEDFTASGLLKIVDLFKKEKKAYDYWMDQGFEALIAKLIYNIYLDIDDDNEGVIEEQVNEYTRQLKAEIRSVLKGRQLLSFGYYDGYYRYTTTPSNDVITSSGMAVVLTEYVDSRWFEERKIPQNRFIHSAKVTIFKDSKDFMLWKLQNQTEE